MPALFAFAGILLLAVTFAPLSRSRVWWIRGLDFPRLQFALVAAALLALEAWLLDLGRPASWALLGLTLLCLGYQIWWILPYTRLYPPEVRSATASDPRRTLRILGANVLTPNRRSEALIRLVRETRPDLVVTLESDDWWQAQLAEIERDYVHTIRCPLDNLYGMHVFSRLPLLNSRIEFLVEEDVPSIHTGVRLESGDEIRMHFLHPAPPSPTENEESTERDAELIVVAKSVAETDAPTIVTGDLNDVAWSRTTRLFRKISGLLDPRVGRGMVNTFHAQVPFLRWPLDHLFHSHHFTLGFVRRLPEFGSDHFAILTELVFEPARGARQAGLEAGPEDQAEAAAALADQEVAASDVPSPEARP